MEFFHRGHPDDLNKIIPGNLFSHHYCLAADYTIKAAFGSMHEYFQFITKMQTKPEIKIKFEWNSFIDKIETT
jgi:hypothetical protein